MPTIEAASMAGGRPNQHLESGEHLTTDNDDDVELELFKPLLKPLRRVVKLFVPSPIAVLGLSDFIVQQVLLGKVGM